MTITTAIKPIKTQADYDQTLQRIEQLMDAEPDTPAFDELDVLATLVEAYEDQHFSINLPDPISAIKFRMEQQGLKQSDLVPYIGSHSKVSEVLSGKRNLSLRMIRELNKNLRIPLNVLIQVED